MCPRMVRWCVYEDATLLASSPSRLPKESCEEADDEDELFREWERRPAEAAAG
jgi:hypothetical protein